ncbi:MAG: FAD-dependent oxidoreductase [Pseudomonadota bacterium]
MAEETHRTTLNDGPVVIVGAGVTGLAAAQLLAEAGAEVVLVERGDALGGLARSWRYDGFTFDVGPHRFHTANADVSAWIERMLGDQSVLFPRRSEVYFQGKYYLWPLKPQQLPQLPAGMALKSGFDLMVNGLRHYGDDSFESYVLRQYGPTLYAHFFKDYTEDFLGRKASETHPDWAKAGINRAIIDDKLQMQNISQLARSTLAQLRPSAPIDFIYPAGGMQTIWDLVRARLQAAGVRIVTGVEATLEAEGERVSAVRIGDERVVPGLVIWTGPINQAAEGLGLPPFELDYRALLLYNVMVEHDVTEPFQWCYYGEHDIVFSRVSMPRFFDAATSPAGTTGICVEVTCQAGDERWRHGERLTDWVVDDLVRVDLIPDRDRVHDVRLERVREAYPIYHRRYPEDLEKAQVAFARFENLRMAGRTGTFWYNNMDHCIEAVFELVKGLLRDAGRAGIEDSDLARGGS